MGLTKKALYKTIGTSTLSLNQYVDLLLDVENNLNNRPLTYNKDDVQMPVLTPNMMIFGQPNHVPERDGEVCELHNKGRIQRLRDSDTSQDPISRREQTRSEALCGSYRLIAS